MKITAKLKNLRISPRKVRLVTNLIKGMDTENALVQLSNAVKGSSRAVEKLLRSAISNAENNFGLDKNNLLVSDVQVGEGPILKRWLPRAHGRATPLMKRTSNVYLVLDEKIEGMKKKTKSVKKAVSEDEKETEKIESDDVKKSEVKEKKKTAITKEAIVKKSPVGGIKSKQGSFSKKVIQRKSA